jgi:hypothetical protein
VKAASGPARSSGAPSRKGVIALGFVLLSASLAFALGAHVNDDDGHGATMSEPPTPPARAPLVQPARIIDRRAAAKSAQNNNAVAAVTLPSGRRILTWGSCTLAAADTRTAVAAAHSVRAQPSVRESAATPPSGLKELSAPTAADERVIARAAKRAAKPSRETPALRGGKRVIDHRSVLANIRFARRARAAHEEGKRLLPELPQRTNVQRVMRSIRQRVQACYDRGMVPGNVVLDITIGGLSGKVVRSRVSAKSSTAECIESLVERLRFPRFARSQATIRYRYSFQ